ncbi:hypothetical protein ECNE1487_4639, partial [Escherichia coli NE1487]
MRVIFRTDAGLFPP